ncbi:MAG: dependent ligase [Devosia sp.]|uniref:ATP-dependent DNA ligase n=1 Tax=Devosia sp. TaxID=1871048 RepID=UPI00260CC628|nr:ATP-dependent DNA ligase [Devosia sp.]MDB5539507.1 dependent ligase [Devosia sp.]
MPHPSSSNVVISVSEAPFEPMEARLVDELPAGPGWQFEPKWDGFRCLAVKRAGEVALFAKSGKPLARYFPDVAETVRQLPADEFVLDGELVIPVDGRLSFDALQMRLHPAESRVRRLVAEHPAILIVFDLPVAPGATALLMAPLTERRVALEHFIIPGLAGVRLSPATTERAVAEDWLAGSGVSLDGVIAKRLDALYVPGEREMLKVKRIRSADCVVGGFRYGTNSKLVGSLLLGLYDDAGLLNHVGFTSMISDRERQPLTEKLEALAGNPGFTGRAPGGPSRWSTERTGSYEKLRHELVVEVLYDQVTGDRFRHGTRLVRWRPDKAPRQCRIEQITGAGDPPDPYAVMLE